MKKQNISIIIICSLAISLTACNKDTKVVLSSPSASPSKTEVQKMKPVVVEESKIDVKMDVTVSIKGKIVSLTGTTNLPDGTLLEIQLNGGQFFPKDEQVVNKGVFKSREFSIEEAGGLGEGHFTFAITSAAAIIQPERVKKIIGANGINLTGKLVDRNDSIGNTVEFYHAIFIGTPPAAVSTDSNDDAVIYTAPSLPDPSIGMIAEDVVNGTTWGKPDDVNRTTTKNGVSEQWVYPGDRYLYFEDGILTAIQE
jgi:hypothetical protein